MISRACCRTLHRASRPSVNGQFIGSSPEGPAFSALNGAWINANQLVVEGDQHRETVGGQSGVLRVLEHGPAYVAQASKPAVSPTSKSAGCPWKPRRPAGLETCDTAGLQASDTTPALRPCHRLA